MEKPLVGFNESFLTRIITVYYTRFSVESREDASLFFREFGYVIVNDALSADELSDFKNEVKGIVNSYRIKAGLSSMSCENDLILSEGLIQLEEADHDYVAAVYDTVISCPSFFRICGNKNTEKFVKNLLEIPKANSLYGFTNRCRIDPPRDDRRTYGWHQEVFYTIPKSRFIQTWAPLIFDTTELNGTIEIAPRSHEEGIALQSWNSLEGRATQIIVNEEVMSQYSQIKLEMKLGEILYFSGKLAHRSGHNGSNQVRYSLVGMYHDVDSVAFSAPKINFSYRNLDPFDYFTETFGTESKAT